MATESISVEVPPTIDPADGNDTSQSDPALIIVNGTSKISTGFAGEDLPQITFPSLVTEISPQQRSLLYSGMARSSKIEQLLPDDALAVIHDYLPALCYVAEERKKGAIEHRPIQQQLITNWEQMQQLWEHCFERALNPHNLSTSDRPVFTTEPALNPKVNREKMTQIFFEQYKVPSFYIGNANTLILYASGRTTGVTVKIGYDCTVAAPIYEGYVESHAVKKLAIGGQHITEYLSLLLSSQQHNLDMRTVNDIKENHCFLNVDKIDSAQDTVEYKLPDGRIINLPKSILCQPAEALFDPKLVGIDEADGISKTIHDAVMKVSVSVRKDLYINTVVAGDTALMNGICSRMQRNIERLAPNSYRAKVIAEQVSNVPFVGASILASLSTFNEMWMTADEYEEQGPGLVHRKCV